MSKDDKTAAESGNAPKSGGLPRGGLIAVAIAGALAILVYNYYTPAPTSAPSSTSSESSSAGTTTAPASTTDTSSAAGSTTTSGGSASTSTTSTSSSTTTSTTASTEVSAISTTPDVAIEELMKPGPLPDIAMGDANAPVTIVEYASMTCPHCAHFHTEVLPQVKAKYIDTGKAKLIFREFPIDNLAVGVSMLARCSDPAKFHAFVSTMFKTQLDWAAGEGSPLPKLKEITKQAGFTEDSFNKCLENQKLQQDIVAIRTRADENFGITGTPTFFLNGIKLKDGFGIEDFDKVMKALGQG